MTRRGRKRKIGRKKKRPSVAHQRQRSDIRRKEGNRFSCVISGIHSSLRPPPPDPLGLEPRWVVVVVGVGGQGGVEPTRHCKHHTDVIIIEAGFKMIKTEKTVQKNAPSKKSQFNLTHRLLFFSQPTKLHCEPFFFTFLFHKNPVFNGCKASKISQSQVKRVS